jgi:hypothetical protein
VSDEIQFIFRPMTKWPREPTPARKRQRSPFEVDLSKTYRLLRYELKHLKAENPVVQELSVRETEIRIDGLLRAGVRPLFPGVILSFRTPKLGPMQYACDACIDWEDNTRAICLTLERLRLIDRYGCTLRGEQYTGWRALPPPIVTPPPMTVEEAAEYVGKIVGGIERRMLIIDREKFRDAYRTAALKLHPDANGASRNSEWLKLQDAKHVLDRHHEGSKHVRLLRRPHYCLSTRFPRKLAQAPANGANASVISPKPPNQANDIGLPFSFRGRKYPLMQRGSQTQIWIWFLAEKPALG